MGEIIPPEDFLSYCPPGVRITDRPISKAPSHLSQKVKEQKAGEKFVPKKIYVVLNGNRVYENAMLVRDISDLLKMSIGTINAAIDRSTETTIGKTRNGYSFEVAVQGDIDDE